MSSFEKSAPRHRDFYLAEAAGLRWLGAAGAPVVEVLEVDSRHIVLEHLHSVPASKGAARSFGAALARMHDAGAGPRFGAPPAGFTGQIFIGSRPMSSRQHDSWGSFYIAERVEPYLRIAVDAGSVRSDQLPVIERAAELVASGAFDDDEAPARIHGDLWNGNLMWTDRGGVLIDPAAHAGHRETDLAMLALFGCPYLSEILNGYQSVHPLRSGWAQRVPLHQLHPLAVHAAGYGPSYGQALTRAAVDTLRIG